MKKFMVLTASLIIGSSCLAMENQNDLISEAAPEAVVAFTVGQTSVPAEIWFPIISEGAEKCSNFKHLAFLRAVSKNWHSMITQHFTNLLRSTKLRANKVEEEIAGIDNQLRNNRSGRRDSGELQDDKTSLTQPISLFCFWDQEAKDLFNKKKASLRQLLENEYPIMVVINKDILYRLIASKPSDRTEIENKGQELVNFIKSVRSINSTIAMDLPDRGEEKKFYTSMGASFARDINKLEESTDVFGAKAKKPRPLAARRVYTTQYEGFMNELEASFRK